MVLAPPPVYQSAFRVFLGGDTVQPLIAVGLGVGIFMNLFALAGLIWKFGSWNGRVTTLLEAHAEDHQNHYTTTEKQGQRIAKLEGRV